MAERRLGSPPVPDVVAYPRERDGAFVVDSNAGLLVRDGDALLGRCELEAPPVDVLISSTGLGVALVDVWPYNLPDFTRERKSALIMITLKGEVKFRKDLNDLLGAEKEAFRSTGVHVAWCLCSWIDERRTRGRYRDTGDQ